MLECIHGAYLECLACIVSAVRAVFAPFARGPWRPRLCNLLWGVIPNGKGVCQELRTCSLQGKELHLVS